MSPVIKYTLARVGLFALDDTLSPALSIAGLLALSRPRTGGLLGLGSAEAISVSGTPVL